MIHNSARELSVLFCLVGDSGVWSINETRFLLKANNSSSNRLHLHKWSVQVFISSAADKVSLSRVNHCLLQLINLLQEIWRDVVGAIFWINALLGVVRGLFVAMVLGARLNRNAGSIVESTAV